MSALMRWANRCFLLLFARLLSWKITRMTNRMSTTPQRSSDVLAPQMALSHFLNFSRAAAALLVLLFHIRTALVVPYDSLDVHNWFTRALFVVSSFGHDAVIVFFVLSGYLVGGAVLRLDMKSSDDLRAYWIDRAVRIGPVLIATTAFSTALQHAAPLFECNDTTTTVLGNALAFQNLLVRPLCNNLPLWSISNEVVYYLVFPVMVAAFLRLFSIWLAISIMGVMLVCILALSLTPLDESNIVLDFPFWLIGTALWFVPGDFRRWRWLALLMVAGALLFGRLDVGKNHFWFRDLFLAVGFSFLLVTFLNQLMPQSGVRATIASYFVNWSRWFAELSFSLYVIHYPLIRLYIYAGLGSETRYVAITPLILLKFMGLTAFCILIAFWFSLLFERPRRLFKKTIVRRLRMS
jgi:peptidoglycan/LPS O-acetylase OafA/YrhL